MRLQRAIFLELTRNLVLIGAGIGFASLVGIVVSATYRARGSSLLQTLELVPHLGAGIVPHLLPLVYLIAVVATYGRLSAERELIAIRMAGIHLWRLLAPAVLLGALLSIVIFHFSSEIEPEMKRRQSEIAKKIAAAVLQPQSSGINELSFSTRGREQSTSFYMSWASRDERGDFQNLFLAYRDATDSAQLRAREATMRLVESGDGRQQILLDLRDALYIDGRSQAGGYVRITRPFDLPVRLRETYTTTTELHARASANERTPLPRAETKEEKQLNKREKKQRLNIWNEIRQREASSLAPLLFALLGIPVSLLLRTSARLATFLVAAGIALLGYYPLTYLGNALASEGSVSPWLGAFGPLLVLGVLAAELLRRAFRV
ncbi:MAG: LptF/LptG family permease [Planctomycetes bacterium]|nr:LptF/LptG family permease [Planctomycetota bacterium]